MSEDIAADGLKVTWVDGGRAPKCAANPKYPDGIHVDMSDGKGARCTTTLPHPAPRIGQYLVECSRCGVRVVVTTAGRADDPCSVTVPCRQPGDPVSAVMLPA